ncbi:MAG: sulfite exporter TauE/SafE family protein [Bryobacterales bacterium]|nr:sulfite exporter TauE/SafE family protein [Bryobacteraceae bacterium]MDW8129997.1 sulfite exporter TauE/SafE family protein [Bryobacterales bacterium]
MELLYAEMPFSRVRIFWPGLVILGFGVGVIGGFFGIGGGWMVTPGLNILGFPMAFAIGTDLAHMAGKSLVSTLRHARFGNVDFRLGVLMVAGTIVGFEAGAQTVMWLERTGRVDVIVRLAYLLLLGLVAWRLLRDVSGGRSDQAREGEGGSHSVASAALRPAGRRRVALRIPPVLRFPRAGVRCSAWCPLAVGLGTGWLSGLMGIGGGLIRVPALIYLLGCPTHVAVGTDLFEVAVSGLYGAATYAYKGRTELAAALIMLIGASAGAQIGAVATKYARGYRIRSMLAVAVTGCGASVLLKLLAAVQPQARRLLEGAATVLILSLVSALAGSILRQFLRGVRQERAARSKRPVALL